MKIFKISFALTLVLSLFLLFNQYFVFADIASFRYTYPGDAPKGICLENVSLSENIDIQTTGEVGPKCDFSITTTAKGDWQLIGGFDDTPPYGWGGDLYTIMQGVEIQHAIDPQVSFTCKQPAYTLNTSSLPSYIELIEKVENPSENSPSEPNSKTYNFSVSSDAPTDATFPISFEMEANCDLKLIANASRDGKPIIIKDEVLEPFVPTDNPTEDRCSDLSTPFNLNPRKAQATANLTMGESCAVWETEEGVPTTAPQPGSSTTIDNSTYTWMCLHAEQTEETSGDNREVALSAPKAPLDKEIYIVGCIEVDGEFKCTTGNENASKLGLSESITGYDFNVITNSGENPITITEGSTLLSSESPIIATSKTNDTIRHVFYAVYEVEDPSQTGQGSSLQYATFAWNKDYSKCITVRWDPYGRVFDSKSLEPISGVTVTLLDKNKDKVSIPGLTNPLKTNKAGFFSFYVPDGDYVLKPVPPLAYSFSASPQLNLNYIRAYSNLYAPNNVIRQRGAPVHVDIPFDPGKNAPAISAPVSISFNALPDNNENTIKVVGQVSHPLTLVSIKQKGEEIINTQADKFGYYEVEINNEDIVAGEPLTPVFTKIDLTQQKEGQATKVLASNNILGISTENTYLAKVISFFSSLFGQDNGLQNSSSSSSSSSVAGESIYIPPSSLKGYVYDKKGDIVKNAKVDIILSMSDKVYNSITSSDNGYILVSDGYLPVFDYYLLVYPKGQSSFKISMGEFLSENK